MIDRRGGGEWEELAAGRADLDLGVHTRTYATVEAGRPPAVVLLVLAQRVLPVLPEPLLVQAGVEVIPRQHLVLVPLAGGEPVQVDAVCRQYVGGLVGPPPEREVLV